MLGYWLAVARIWCRFVIRKKLLLTNYWLMGDVDLVCEKNTSNWLADKLAKQSE